MPKPRKRWAFIFGALFGFATSFLTGFAETGKVTPALIRGAVVATSQIHQALSEDSNE